MTLGTVEKNVELNYQFEFDYENEAGNMHFGSFDMTESGMIATVSASDIGLTEGVTELSLTLNYSQVFGDCLKTR